MSCLGSRKRRTLWPFSDDTPQVRIFLVPLFNFKRYVSFFYALIWGKQRYVGLVGMAYTGVIFLEIWMRDFPLSVLFYSLFHFFWIKWNFLLLIHSLTLGNCVSLLISFYSNVGWYPLENNFISMFFSFTMAVLFHITDIRSFSRFEGLFLESVRCTWLV